MVSLKSLSSSLSNKDKDKDKDSSTSIPPPSSTPTKGDSSSGSLSDWTDAGSPTQAHDMAPTTQSGDATYVLSAQTDQGHAVVGSAPADPANPSANPISDDSGKPVTAVPSATKGLTGVVTSGEQGLGPHGTATLDAVRSPPLAGQKEAVVGSAKGVQPEAVVVSSDKKEKDDTPWFKRFKIGKDSSSGDVTEDGEEQQSEAVDGLGAVTKVAPVGADVSNLKPKDGANLAPAGAVKPVVDKDGQPIPTKLSASAAATSVSPSIKDKISTMHDTDPKTTNEHFHELFSQVPAEDELIEDYRCALQRDILVQGRLYVSEHHLSFRANIFGWETTISLPWTEITTIEKKMTALVIPNAIEITSLHTSHTFASLLSRDTCYDLLVTLWRHAHPEATKSGDDTASVTVDPKRATNDNQSEVSYTDDDGHKKKFKFKPHLPSAFKGLGSIKSSKDESKMTEAEKVKAAAQGGHKATTYEGDEYEHVALEVTLPTSPEKAADLFFKNVDFLKPFWEGKEGLKEVDVGEWTKEGEVEKRDMHYIKPLNGAVGPKQTLCNIKDEEEHNDPEEYITVVTTTQTPDVPSGSDFSVKTRTVFTWAATGGCAVKVTTEVAWTKVNRMLKGIIEKSCLNGQKSYHNDLEEAVRDHIKENEAEYAVAGLSADDAEATAKKADSEGGILSTLASFIPDPTITLIVVVVLLLFSNFWTLIALRHQARAAHEARLGSPGEVAGAVSRVLTNFNKAHAMKSSGNGNLVKEVTELGKIVKGLEDQLAEVADRLAGLAGKV